MGGSKVWLSIGLIIGAGSITLALLLRQRKISVRWYEWLIGVAGLLLLLFTIQNFSTSLAGYEEYAAWTFLWVFGLPSILFLAIAFLLPWIRHRKAGR